MDDVTLGGNDRGQSVGFNGVHSRGRDRSTSSGPRRRTFGRSNSHHRSDVRGVAALLVMFLIAALCPIIGSSSTPADAADRPSIEQLPSGFQPLFLNEKGEIAGTTLVKNVGVTAIYANGELEIVPGGPVYDIFSFNDDGEMLVRVQDPNNRYVLQLRDRSGIVTSFDPPTNNGDNRNVAWAWGPDKAGRVLANVGFQSTWDGVEFNGSGLLYQPAGGYSPLTSVSTTLAMTKTGSIFGFKHGGDWQNPVYSLVRSDGGTTTLTGLGYVYQVNDMSNAGKILFYNSGGYSILDNGTIKKVTEPPQPTAINDKGVIAGYQTSITGSYPVLRFADGTIQSLADITNSVAEGWKNVWTTSDMNDKCDIIGRGELRVGTALEQRAYLAHVPNCEVSAFAGGFARPDTGIETVYVGEQAKVRLRIANVSDEDISNVELVDVGTRETAFGGSLEITESSREMPEVLKASGVDSQGFIWFDVDATETGKVWLVAHVRGIRNGKTVTGTMETLFSIKGGLALTITQANNVIFGADNNGDDKINADDEIVELNVKVENTTTQPITDIGPSDLSDPLRFKSRIADLGVMLEPVELPKQPIAELDAGKSETLVYKYRASDKVAADIEAIFRGMQDGRQVSGVGRGQVKVGSEIWARVSLSPENRPYRAGQTIRLTGKIENVSEVKDDAGNVTQEGRPIGVMVEPVVKGNAGGGHVFDPARTSRTPTSATAFRLDVGESLDIGAVLGTLETDKASQAEVKYTVSVWDHDVEPGEDPIKGDETNIEWVRDGDSSDSHTIPLAPEVYPGAEPYLNCPADLPGLEYISCRFSKGAFAFAQGSWDLASITVYGTGQFFRGYWGVITTLSWAEQQMVEFMLGDDEARERLAAEIAIDLQALQDVGVESLKGLTITAQGIVPALADALHDMDQVLHRGDMRAVVGGMAEFGGSNIDSMLGFGLLVRSRLAARALAGAAGAEGAVKDAIEAASRKQASELEGRVASAIGEGKSLPKGGILKSGDDVTNMPHVHKAFGATERDVANLIKIAVDEDVIIPFRSRSVKAGQMIEAGQALPKPGSVPIKTVNEFDEYYLKYKPEWNSQAVLVEPPIPWKAAGAERDALVEAYLDGFTELTRTDAASMDLRNIVRERLETRLDEWPKQLELFSQYVDNGIDVNFYSGKNGLSDKLMPNNKPNLTARIVPDPIPGVGGNGGRAAFRLEMADPVTGKFKAIVGDIDFLGIFNRDGSPVTDIAKRLRIYKKMRSLLGMQHGESFTFTVENLRKKFLECCTASGETMLAPTPDGKLIATHFDDSLSVLTAGPNAAMTNNSALPLFSFGRLISDYESQLTGSKGGKLPTLSEYLSDFIKSKLPAPPQSPKDIRDLLAGLEKQVRPKDQFNRSEGEALRANKEQQLERYKPPKGTTRPQLKPMLMLSTQTPDPADTVDGALQQLIAQGYDEPDTTVGASGGVWEVVDPNEILGDDDQFQILPLTYIGDPAEPGDTTLDVLAPAMLRMASNSPFFVAGDQIVIDPGGQHEEFATVASVGDGVITLTEPLTRTHNTETSVILPTAASAADPGDSGGTGDTGNTGNAGNTGGTGGTGSQGTTKPSSTTPVASAAQGGKQAATQVQGATDTAKSDTGDTGRLAFTGGNSFILVLLGAALLGAGVTITESRRRRIRRRPAR